jgi:hypothetical protein
VFMEMMPEWFINWHIKRLWLIFHALGIITRLVFLSLNLFLILLERWPQNASIASILSGFDNTPGQHSHTHPSQFSINSDVIHAFFLDPNYYIFAKFSFCTVLLFNITYDGNLLPFAVIHSMTITHNFHSLWFSLPCVFPLWNLWYNCEACRKNAVSSALLIWLKEYLFL